MTEKQAKKLATEIAARYPVPAWPQESLAAYAHDLADLDFDAALAAVHAWARTQDERPTIAAVRRAVVGRQLDAAGHAPLTPEQAWGVVNRAVRDVGHSRPFPARRFPLVAEAVEAVGWRAICQSNENDGTLRAHFFRTYAAVLERHVSHAAASTGAVVPPALMPPARTDQALGTTQRPAAIPEPQAAAPRPLAALTGAVGRKLTGLDDGPYLPGEGPRGRAAQTDPRHIPAAGRRNPT